MVRLTSFLIRRGRTDFCSEIKSFVFRETFSIINVEHDGRISRRNLCKFKRKIWRFNGWSENWTLNSFFFERRAWLNIQSATFLSFFFEARRRWQKVISRRVFRENFRKRWAFFNKFQLLTFQLCFSGKLDSPLILPNFKAINSDEKLV